METNKYIVEESMFSLFTLTDALFFSHCGSHPDYFNDFLSINSTGYRSHN